MSREALHWAVCHALDLPWATYLPDGITMPPVVSHHPNNVQTRFRPCTDAAQAELILGSRITDETNRIESIRTRLTALLGPTIDVPDEIK